MVRTAVVSRLTSHANADIIGRVSAAGGRRADRSRAGRGPLPSILATLLGAALAGVAWFYLVHAAIDFGSLARQNHQVVSWAMTVLPAVGAVACLLLVITLMARVLYTLGLINDYKPRRAGARRRAK